MTATVAWHEFRFTVKRPGYLIVTLGMPVILLLYVGVIALITAAAVPAAVSGLTGKLGVVDESGLLNALPQNSTRSSTSPGDPLKRPNAIPSLQEMVEQLEANSGTELLPPLERFEARAEAEAAVRDGRIDDVIVIPADYVECGELVHYTRQWRLLSGATYGTKLRGVLGRAVMHRAGMSESEITRTRMMPKVRVFEIGPQGDFVEANKLQKGLNFGVPLGVVGILLVSLMINAGFLSTGIAEEKENKVLEVLLSSVRPKDLLLGKVLGLGTAAILQIGIWLAMAGVFPLILMAAIRQHVEFDLNLSQFVYGVVFFILGFLFYGALLVGFGSLGNNIKECQQWSILIVLLPLAPVLAVIPLLESPNGLAARLISYIPLFSPTAMMMRLASNEVAFWDVAISAIILLVSTWLAVRFSARLFKVGTLMYGKSPNPLTVLRLFLQAK